MPAATGSTRRSWSIPVWSPRASPTTSPRSTRRSSRSSRRACTRSSGRRRGPPRKGSLLLGSCRGSGPMITTEIRTGQMFADRYRVIRRLGTGGMATVWLAEDERLGREVAVKRLKTDAPEESLARFRREARLGATLNHPNFVSVFDTIATDEGALIVMEYVPGRSLEELVARGPMNPDEAISILRGAAAALDHAHREGVVHRDIKPANILVRDDGMVKLADLGIARALDATQITSEGKVIGTMPYMAPERLEAAGAGGPASDVYALAAVAYQLLSGSALDAGATGQEHPPDRQDLAAGWPDAPAPIFAVVMRGLSRDPARRQGSAGQ